MIYDNPHRSGALGRAVERIDNTESTDDTGEIRAQIEQTRSQMGETIDAIQARLNPQHIGEQVKEQVREQFHEATATVREATIGRAEQMVRSAGDSINEARYGFMETIRQNPIPTAMAAIGLSWLFMNRRSAPPRRYDERFVRREPERYYPGESAYPYGPAAPPGAYTYGYQEGAYRQEGSREQSPGLAQRAQEAAGGAMHKAQERVSDTAGQARDATGNIIGQARDAAGSLAGQAQHQARRVEDTFQGAMFENPLGVAAVALALGAAVGLGLPQTERENQLMGEARDKLLERAQEVAQDTAEKAQAVAGEVTKSAQQTAREQAREQGLTSDRPRS